MVTHHEEHEGHEKRKEKREAISAVIHHEGRKEWNLMNCQIKLLDAR